MTTRKEFLASGTLAALAPAVATAAPASTPAPSSMNDELPPFQFDRGAFDEIVRRDARHRHSFASTKLGNGTVLDAIQSTLEAYSGPLHESIAMVATAAVLYHGASIALAFSDDAWNKYFIPSLAGAPKSVKDDVGSPASGSGNPYLRADKPNDPTVPSLIVKGTAFFVCNNALSGFSQIAASALKHPVTSVYADLKSMLLKGAMVVPAGVWAVGALQEAGYTYLQTTL
jgi:intracellular sulfur oxidation DsrE/DsrF family protein